MGAFDLATIFSFPFMANALIAIVALAIVGSAIGVFVNLRNLEFISDGLAHSVFPGLVIGYVAGGTDHIFTGALVAGLVGALLLTFVTRRGVRSDAGIAVVLTSMFSLGVVIVSRESGYVGQLEQLLFGRILTVTTGQLQQIVVVLGIALLLVAVTWRAQMFRAFDATGFQAAGYREIVYDVVLNVAVALVVVAGSAAVGNLLVLAFLIVPVAMARLMTTRLTWVAPLAAILAVGLSVLGLVIGFDASYYRGISPSPSAIVVLTITVGYGVVLVAHVLSKRIALRRAAE